MKKSVRRLAFGALAAAAAVQFAACRNRPETVYGPPEYFTKTDPGNNVSEDVYGPPEYFTKEDPSNNVPEVVYGPPEYFTEADPVTQAEPATEAEPATQEEPATEAEPETQAPEAETGTEEILPGTDFTVEDNIVECLYGPPEMLETWQQATEFVPEENEPEDVYGPPSMLGAREPEEAAETAAAETTGAGTAETEAKK